MTLPVYSLFEEFPKTQKKHSMFNWVKGFHTDQIKRQRGHTI